MLLHVALIAEIMATVVCLHCIYGKKVKFDVKTVGLILGVLTVLEIINNYHLKGVYSFGVYIFLLLYCVTEFKSSIVEAVISLILYIVILTIIQFVCFFVVYISVSSDKYSINALGNILTLITCCTGITKCGLHRLQESIFRKSKYVMMVFAFMCAVVVVMLLQGKVSNELQVKHFVLVVPAIIILLYSIFKWFKAQTEAERIEEEICKVEENTKQYESLLINVRLRQHELKNHITAVSSAHYTHNTYETLVSVQEDYCKTLMHEHKYTNLLLLGDAVLVGFLYGKFEDAERNGVNLKYRVTTKVEKIQVPIYYVIEMLGILLDNAIEAQKYSNSINKCIDFEVNELGDGYEFSIKNPYRYVPFEEMMEWFQLGNSVKGNERGLGLYHLKKLCEEWKCDIGCRNTEIEQYNWITFTLKIGKANGE